MANSIRERFIKQKKHKEEYVVPVNDTNMVLCRFRLFSQKTGDDRTIHLLSSSLQSANDYILGLMSKTTGYVITERGEICNSIDAITDEILAKIYYQNILDGGWLDREEKRLAKIDQAEKAGISEIKFGITNKNKKKSNILMQKKEVK